MVIIDTLLATVKQTNLIVKSGKDLLMGGELDLTNLDGVGVSISCYIGKKKKSLNQEVEGNVVTLPTYVMANPSVTPLIETHDLLIGQNGEKYIVGEVTIKNSDTTINNILNDASYLYADLEIYEEA